jgi:hypothetical protein
LQAAEQLGDLFHTGRMTIGVVCICASVAVRVWSLTGIQPLRMPGHSKEAATERCRRP